MINEYRSEIKDLLLHGKNDIIFFARVICRCDTKLFKEGKSKFGDLHPGAVEWLQNSTKRENLLHAGNRWFKSGSQAIKFLHKIIYNDNDPRTYRCVNVAISSEQSNVIFNKTLDLFQNSILPKEMLLNVVRFPQPIAYFMRLMPAMDGTEPKLDKVEFWARTSQNKGKYLEGFDFRYINFDEPALELHLDFLRNDVLLPRTGDYSSGQVDYCATPKGYNAYSRLIKSLENDPSAYVQGGAVAALIRPSKIEELLEYRETNSEPIRFLLLNPYIAKEYVADALKRWPIDKIKQVIFGEIVATSNNPFSERIAKIINPMLKLSKAATNGRSYLNVFDLARGKKGDQADKTVAFTADITEMPWKIVDYEAFQLPWVEENPTERGKATNTSIEGKIRSRAFKFQGRTVIDATGIGDTISEVVSDVAEPFIFTGRNTQGMSKEDAILHTQAVMDSGQIETPYIEDFINEMTYYELDDKGLDTDHVMAFVILCSQQEVVDPELHKPIKYIPRG
jgi:hypothetical protein